MPPRHAYLVRFVEASRGEVVVTEHATEDAAEAKAWQWVEFVAGSPDDLAAWKADNPADADDWRAAFDAFANGRETLDLDPVTLRSNRP